MSSRMFHFRSYYMHIIIIVEYKEWIQLTTLDDASR